MTNYIDQQIDKISYEMALKEVKRTKFLLGLFIGMLIGLAFGCIIFLQWLISIPCR